MCERHILPQILLIYADKRQFGEIYLLKQMPQITQRKTVATLSR